MLALFFGLTSLLGLANSCPLGSTITALRVAKNGSYQVTCSTRRYQICPDHCTWTSGSCEEVANKYRWDTSRLMVTNVTYGEPIKGKARKQGDDQASPTLNPPSTRTGLTSTSAAPARTPSTASQRNPSNEKEEKGLQKRCCRGSTMKLSNCQSVDWRMNPTRNDNTFDVRQLASKCPTRNPVLQDIKVIDKNHLALSVCCLNHSVDYNGRVVCLPPKRAGEEGEAATAIALGVALPLALGIGIPYLLRPTASPGFSCAASFTRFDGKRATGCSTTFFSDVATPDECCAICGEGGFIACYLVSTFCNVCPSGPFTLQTQLAETTFVRK